MNNPECDYEQTGTKQLLRFFMLIVSGYIALNFAVF